MTCPSLQGCALLIFCTRSLYYSAVQLDLEDYDWSAANKTKKQQQILHQPVDFSIKINSKINGVVSRAEGVLTGSWGIE